MFYKMFFGQDSLRENERYTWNGREFIVRRGIPRESHIYSETQTQTRDAFGYKWNQRSTYESPEVKTKTYDWLLSRYFDGDESKKLGFIRQIKGSLFLDAGCGSAYSSLLLFDRSLNDVHYLGMDISDGISVAGERLKEEGVKGELIQASIADLPIQEPIFDVIFSEGVLHHTNSTREALGKIASLLRPHGYMLFYVYRKKGPIREFVDDFVRSKIRSLTDEQAWEKLKPLTRLGKALGDLNATLEIKDDIDILEIPRGKYDLQRFFYWHIAKLYYDPNYTLDEMNHVNFDWYRPLNAHRQTPEDIKEWCVEFGLDIIRMHVEEAGITVIAGKS